MIIRNIRLIIGGILLVIGFIIIDKNDLLDIVNNVKEQLQNKR